MRLFIEKEGMNKEIQFVGTVQELLSKLKINPETVLVVKNGGVVTEDESLNNQDNMKILSIISGG